MGSEMCIRDRFKGNWQLKVEAKSSVREVKIGKQIWMTENLNVDRFRNGDLIPEARTNEEWVKAGKVGKPAWCYYNNDPENGKKYGKLYNWYAVNDPRGLAPKDYHIPSDAEWALLTGYLGGENVAGGKMKTTSGWSESGNGNNSSGFSGLPGGLRHLDGMFDYICEYGIWWSSTEFFTLTALSHGFNFAAYSADQAKRKVAISVRCLRD